MNNDLFKVKKLVQLPGYEWLTERGLRHMLFMAESNGLKAAGAIVKLGRTVLIDKPRFDAWVAQHRVS